MDTSDPPRLHTVKKTVLVYRSFFLVSRSAGEVSGEKGGDSNFVLNYEFVYIYI